MSNRDALEIFRQFWPEHGFAGVEPHLPGWTRSGARAFACRHGIKMIAEKRESLFREAGEAASAAMREKAQASWDGKPQATTVNRALAMRW